MTHERLDRLDDLVQDVPQHVRADPGPAWARGARRRFRARVVTTTGAVVVVAVLAALLGVLPRAGVVQPADGRSGVDGFPVRIEKPWRIGDLPDEPGPLAGLLQSRGDRGWLAVSATGQVWELPHQSMARRVWPALSEDGTLLAYLDEDHAPGARWVVRDLVDGSETAYGPSISTRQRATFSPDGRRVLVVGPNGADAVVLGPDGAELPVSVADDSFPVGWADDETLVVLRRGGRPAIGRLGLDGVASPPVAIDPQVDGRIAMTEQDHAAVSPDGTTLALRTDFDGSGVLVEEFDVSTGVPGESIRVEGSAESCQVAWRGDDALVTTSGWGGSPALLRGSDPGEPEGRSVVVADPDLEVDCSVWAADALAGEPHRGITGTLFGTSDLVFWWWWRDVVLALAVGLVARAVPFRRLWRRLRRTPDSP